jgi:hypothetical protein
VVQKRGERTHQNQTMGHAPRRHDGIKLARGLSKCQSATMDQQPYDPLRGVSDEWKKSLTNTNTSRMLDYLSLQAASLLSMIEQHKPTNASVTF